MNESCHPYNACCCTQAIALLYFRKVQDDHLRRQSKHRTIIDTCKKVSVCPHCGVSNGPIKKVPASGGTRYLMLIHDQFAKNEQVCVCVRAFIYECVCVCPGKTSYLMQFTQNEQVGGSFQFCLCVCVCA